MNDDLFTPLDEDEFDLLNDFLLERFPEEDDPGDVDEGILDISELDGFFTAIVSSPEMILPSQWLSQVWGDFEPEWQDEQQSRIIIELLMRHMNSNASTLMQEPDEFEPVFLERVVEDETYTIVDEWCEGYMRGVFISAEQWDLQEMEMKLLLAPIMAFSGEMAMNTHNNFNLQEIQNLQNTIPENIRKIHAYWLMRRKQQEPQSTFINSKLKVGRNDPCPCGSGKKFKKCCLH